jgi:hypothetical protein
MAGSSQPKKRILAAGEEPPGRWLPDERAPGRTWSGELQWHTRHGLAVCDWMLGKPWVVENALLPDGSRGRVQETMELGWRRREGRDRWIYGQVELQADEIRFRDNPDQPVAKVPTGPIGSSLARDLWSSPEIVAQSRRYINFACLLAGSLSYYRWHNFRNGSEWSCGRGDAGSIVAALRDKGDYWLDFKVELPFDESEPAIGEEDLLPLIAKLGWFPFDPSFYSEIEAARLQADRGEVVPVDALRSRVMERQPAVQLPSAPNVVLTQMAYDVLAPWVESEVALQPAVQLPSGLGVVLAVRAPGPEPWPPGPGSWVTWRLSSSGESYTKLLADLLRRPTSGRFRPLPSAESGAVYLNAVPGVFLAHEVRAGTVVILKAWSEEYRRSRGWNVW